MKTRFVLFLHIFIFQAFIALAAGPSEKKPLTHDDYASWNSLAGQVLSADGQWMAYEVNPQQGDGNLIIHHFASGKNVLIPRGHSASISPGNRFVVFYIRPQHDIVRQARLEGKKPDQIPADSLGIFNFEQKKLTKVPGPVTYAMPLEGSDWVAYHVDRSSGRSPSRRPWRRGPAWASGG